MAIDKLCSRGCGRWGRATSDICEVCASNRSRWKGESPAARMRYRQRLALANRRQIDYAHEFGDKPQIDDIEPIEPKGRGTGRRKADVIPFNRKGRKTTKRRSV